jgi:hypothetical protein
VCHGVLLSQPVLQRRFFQSGSGDRPPRWPCHGSTVDPKYRLSPGPGSEIEPALGPQPAEIAALSKS